MKSNTNRNTLSSFLRKVSLIRNYLNTNKRKVAMIENRVFLIFLIIVIPLFFFSVATGLYMIKTQLGIDLLHGVHMGRYLGL